MSLKFSNSDLQAIHAKAEKEIASRVSQLDTISDDIKTLDQVLSKAAISMKYMYCYFQNRENKSYGAQEETKDESRYIVWNPEKNRLYHEVHVETEFFDVECGFHRDHQVLESKPLIEVKAQVRLKVQPELSIFYEQIISALKKGQYQEIVKDSSPNLLDNIWNV